MGGLSNGSSGFSTVKLSQEWYTKTVKQHILFVIVAVGIFSGVYAHAATLRLSPAEGSFVLGSTFDVSIILNTQGAAVNTVETELTFPPKILQLVNPSLGRSIVQIWASPPTYSNQEGRIYLIGGIPAPGITTSEGIVQSFTFRVIAPGQAKIGFGARTSILANDGLGTDVLKQVGPAIFRLVLPSAQGPAIFSPTHPEQGTWYKDPNPIIHWDASGNSEGFSFSVDHDPKGTPDTTIDTREAQTSLTNLASGEWYFHVREKAGGSSGGKSHFIVNIDTLPPAAFGVAVSPGARTSDKNPILRFFTTDTLSGFDHFEIKVVSLAKGPTENTFFFEATSPHQLLGITSGRYEVIVRAFDKAGNTRDESVTLHIVSSLFNFISGEGLDLIFFVIPWNILIPILLILFILFGILSWTVVHRHHHHLRHIVRYDLMSRKPKALSRK